jgi:hypothetical protein
MGPSGPGIQDLAADRQRLFNGKELVTSTKSAYQLCWPIALWGVLVLVLYAVSYTALSAEHDTMVYIKMTHKARIAASRVTYYAMRMSLEPVRRTLPAAMLTQFYWHERKQHRSGIHQPAGRHMPYDPPATHCAMH